MDKFDKGDGIVLAKDLKNAGVTLAFQNLANARKKRTVVYEKFWSAVNTKLFGTSPSRATPSTNSCPPRTNLLFKIHNAPGASRGGRNCFMTSSTSNSDHIRLGDAYTAMVTRISGRFGALAAAGALPTDSNYLSLCGLSKNLVCTGGSENAYGCQTGATCSTQWIGHENLNQCLFPEQTSHEACCASSCQNVGGGQGGGSGGGGGGLFGGSGGGGGFGG